MLGYAGALCCLAGGTALGSWMRDRRLSRWRMLQAQLDMLGGMRLLLEQERPALPELLLQCAGYAGKGIGAEQAAQRLSAAAQMLLQSPMEGIAGAYLSACMQIPADWEKTEERAAMEQLFQQLGSGTAAMREQAVAACIRRLRPLEETARREAEQGGRLCMQLGLLLGLMAGIAVW